MAYTKKTLADLLQSFSDRYGETTQTSDTTILARRTRFLNQGQSYCADLLRLEKPATVTIASGVGNLPDDFLVINKVSKDNNEYVQISQDDIASQTGPVYWITGNQTDGFVLNIPDDGSYDIIYAFKPAEMVNTTDKCIIPDPEAVVAYAYGMLRKSETDPVADALPSLQECDRRINEMIDQYTINSNFTGFSLDPLI
jgi:hypothetical protein